MASTIIANKHVILLNCHSLMPFYGIMYAWNGKITERMIFQGFGTK